MAVVVSQNGNSNGFHAELAPRQATIKELLSGTKAAVLFGVHNALGAKIAEEAGADGLWISSFEVHAAHRLPDADILGTQDYVSVVQQIVDRVSIPVFVDGNAGGGNAINTIRLVREFEKAGASGMCIEDNRPPNAARSTTACRRTSSPRARSAARFRLQSRSGWTRGSRSSRAPRR